MIWRFLVYFSVGFISATIIDFFITPRPIKNLNMVYTPFPILNGLEIILPKAKRWEDSPCIQFQNLAKTYDDVYQIKFGTKLIIVANSYESIKQLWCSKNIKANNSRPINYSFHKVLSKGIYTIGTTPIGETYRKSRKHISERVLSDKRNNDFNYVIMNNACDEMIDKIINQSINNNNKNDIDIDIDIKPNLVSNDMVKEAQYFHLKVALWLTYGFEFNINDLIHQHLGDEIIDVENRITKVRSHVQNPQDYLPYILRLGFNLCSTKNYEFGELYNKRDRYLKMFYQYALNLYDDINSGKMLHKLQSQNNYTNAINKIEDLKNTLMYNYFDVAKSKLAIGEITSECLTMVSAGLDNTPLNFKYGLHQMVNYHPEIWDKAFNDLIQYYKNDYQLAYKECANEMKSEYVKAIVNETLRLFTVLPMSLPRESTDIIAYKDAIIPKGTTLFMNCWAANHDPKKFPDPMEFVPDRWLISIVDNDFTEKMAIDPTMKHFAFGIGCRKCLGNNFAFRELYILFSKMILRFKPTPVTERKYQTIPSDNSLKLNQYPESLAIEPEPFDLILERRPFDADIV